MLIAQPVTEVSLTATWNAADDNSHAISLITIGSIFVKRAEIVDNIMAGSSAVWQSKTLSLCRCHLESKTGTIHRVKHWQTTLAILAALSTSLALAEDFKTISGKEYKNATVSRVEPDGLLLRTKSGISKIYFSELPKEVQEPFHYEPQQAAQYTAQTLEQIRITQQQKIQQDQKRADEIARNLAIVRQQQKLSCSGSMKPRCSANDWKLSNSGKSKLIPNPLIPDLRKESQSTRTSLHRIIKSILAV